MKKPKTQNDEVDFSPRGVAPKLPELASKITANIPQTPSANLFPVLASGNTMGMASHLCSSMMDYFMHSRNCAVEEARIRAQRDVLICQIKQQQSTLKAKIDHDYRVVAKQINANHKENLMALKVISKEMAGNREQRMMLMSISRDLTKAICSGVIAPEKIPDVLNHIELITTADADLAHTNASLTNIQMILERSHEALQGCKSTDNRLTSHSGSTLEE
tara:strand:+ start:468 stop:1124 length:657 start_codon:yes stop_codon:yes gene_type:complete